jgi:hypothetical protein|tara:strand:+ start:436 stop:732 length:297 start_codon:yes stop_codon:yes gene_type:complete
LDFPYLIYVVPTLEHNRNIFAIPYLACKHMPTIYDQSNIKGLNMHNVKKLIGFSPDDSNTISSAAGKVGLSFSAFTRSAALKEASKIVPAQATKSDPC